MTNVFELSVHNPWWKNPEKINGDPHLQVFDSSEIKWRPGMMRYIKLDVDDYVLYTIRGPRQVGKTTMVKLIMRELLLEKGIDPLRVFFWPCDMVPSANNLRDIMLTYIEYARQSTSKQLFMFLDEITSVRDWQTAIKILFDTGKLKNVSILACGSHAMDIQAGTEKLPGRTGKSDTEKNKRLVPMKFCEFVKCYDTDMGEEIDKKGLLSGGYRRKILTGLIKNTDNLSDLSWLLMNKKELDNLLDVYLLTGGIAQTINEYKKTKRLSNGIYDEYLRAFQSDLSHWRRDPHKAKHIVSQIIQSMGSIITWDGIKSNIMTQPTAKSYVDAMYDCFIVLYFHRLRSLHNKKIAEQKGKKAYIADPFIFHAMKYWTQSVGTKTAQEIAMEYLEDPGHRGVLIESVVANHLVRYAFDLNPSDHFDSRYEIFYWKDKYEIDFLLNFENNLLPIEVKYRNTIPSKTLRQVATIAQQEGLRGIIVSKDDFEEGESVVTIPASILLFLV